MLLMDPGSPAFDSPKKYGYKLLFRTLNDYVNGMSSPAWTDWLSYETHKLNRTELLRLPLRFRDKLVRFYHSSGLISDENNELMRYKIRIDETIIDELETIRRLKEVNKKERRYRALHRAIKDYDRGILSLSWRIKKGLGILGFS